MASGANSSERKWKSGLLFCVALIMGVLFQNSYLDVRNQMVEVRYCRVDIAGGTAGPDVLYSELSGNLAGGQDRMAKSRPSSS